MTLPLLSGVQTVNISGVSPSLLTDKVCVLYIKFVRVLCVFCESAVCVQVSVNIFDHLIRMVGHRNQSCHDEV